MKRFAATVTGGLALLTCALYARWATAEPTTAPAVPTGVKSITLPSMQPDLPAGPGRDTIVGACAFCHSGRYVLNQPHLPRKTWTAVVDKMRKTYGAPLTDAQAADAVNYLVSVRGVDEPTTKP